MRRERRKKLENIKMNGRINMNNIGNIGREISNRNNNKRRDGNELGPLGLAT
jgi:hypothetical protein